MPGPQNAQDFIRALKASSDPPQVGGPLKIDIAREAWENTRLYVPNKAEAIVEWILTRLLKDKARDRAANPVWDSRYWALLSSILVSSGADKHGDNGRALRAWLVPLLSRVPIGPVVLAYLEALSTEASFDPAQYGLVAQCIAILWPLAVPKFNPETLLECFGAAVHLLAVHGGPELSEDRVQALDAHRALSLTVSSYRAALSNAGSKRKQLYTLFLQKHLDVWLRVATRDNERTGVQPPLTSDVYDAGIDTIFGLDILRPSIDQKHDTALAGALERILGTESRTVLRPLPRLFASYVQTVKRHKGALFGQGSSQSSGQVADQVQVASMAFHAVCDALARSGDDQEYWRCRVALLEVVERENLLSLKDEDAKTLLRQDGDIAVQALNTAWDDVRHSITDSAVKVLAALTHIDYDLMASSAAVIVPRLIAMPATVKSALEYTNLLLEYDSKTRNLPISIMHLSEAFSVKHLQRIPGGPKAAYEVASAGPLTSLPFFDELSRAVHNFLTPGQVLETISDVSRTLKEAYDSFQEREARLSADRGDGPRKKRKKDTSVSEDRTEPEYYAVSFALVARTMVVVLRSLPLHTLTEDGRLEAQSAIGEVYRTVTSQALRDGLLQFERMEAWHWQTVVTGALRLHHGLVHVPGVQEQIRMSEALSSAMLSCISTIGISQESVVEVFRTLLHQCSLGTLSPTAVLDQFLGHLEAHLLGHKTTWTGKAHALRSEPEAAIALLHLLADRWLPYFDAWSTPEQHKRFAKILINVRLDVAAPSPGSSLSVPVVITRMLHDAQFWELPNTRDAFIAQLSQQTAPLDELQLPELLSQSATSASRRAPEDVLRFVSAYDILLVTPPEYLPRSTQIELLRRGLVADVLAFATLRHNKKSKVSAHHLLVIREFLRRTIAFLGSVENMTKDFLEYLVEHASTHSEASSAADRDLSSVTMELIDMYQGSLVRSVRRGSAGLVTELVNRYVRCFNTAGSASGRRAALLLLDSVARGDVAEFPTEVVDALRSLAAEMLAFSKKHFLIPRGLELPLDLDLLDTWSHTQTLRRWLQEPAETPVLGGSLARQLFSWKGEERDIATVSPVVLVILLGEVQVAPPTGRGERLEFVIVAYLTLSKLCGNQELASLESRLGAACRTFSMKDFGTLLELIYESLPSQSGLGIEDVASLIRLSPVVLHNAPEGTSKICQSFVTRCLGLFADDERFTADPRLRKELIDLIVRQCNEKPASLRTADLSSLWSLIGTLLAGSPTHEHTTDSAVFHGVVNILSALVRLRRDLVLNTLPHLGFVLRQLLACLRTVRPQLGGKQSRLVLDTLPRWISASQPLSSTESKAIARLLTTLTTKTMVRVHGPAAAETQKPEALARPFSKHAAGVLTAYVTAMNDPLCFVAAAVRRELQPGLFALCDMLGEHNRDAMMVSALDAGGKVTMKALWKEYEKQRYVGKG
ncbi:Urb2/Npa2 family-domain-containing protein [Trametes maxima]|nr:Urb2/Npa2 family-domain-containing protein [Trametes maxima]